MSSPNMIANTTNCTPLIDSLRCISCNQFTTYLCKDAGREGGNESPEGLRNFPGFTRPNGKGAILMSFHPVSRAAHHIRGSAPCVSTDNVNANKVE